MNRQQYLEFHKDACDKMSALTRAKNEDYCGDGGDPFANFSRVEAMGITDTMRGFLVRMTDKLSRLTSFAQKGHYNVSDESFEDTCLDLANYAILLAAYNKGKQTNIDTDKASIVPALDARASTTVIHYLDDAGFPIHKGAK